jgi:hypothetical protein
MADVILVLESSVPFDAAEWVGVGKFYKDVGQKGANQASEGRECSTKTAAQKKAAPQAQK